MADTLQRLGTLASAVGESALVRLPAGPGPAGLLSVLTCHRVGDPPQFARLVHRLADSERAVSIDTVLAAAAGDATLPPRAVLLTFDDGHPSVVDHALPVLRVAGVPAVVFVVSDLVDTDQPFWWDEVIARFATGARVQAHPAPSGRALADRLKRVSQADRLAALDELRATTVGDSPRTRQVTTAELHELEEGGVAVGSHTASHPLLDRCDDATIDAEVAGSRRRLSELLGHPVRTFAYPNGRVDQRTVDAVRRAGYDLAFSWNHALARVPFGDPFRIPRVRTDAASSRDRFMLLAQGRHPSLRRKPQKETSWPR